MLRPARSALRQAAVTSERGHRPWPPPERPWFMAQSWRHLLFAHWRVDPAELRAVVHPEVPVDTFDGSAWVGVTPFLVDGFRLHGTPPVPVVHSFREVNVRTYATIDGKPGIWFFSLDASSRLAVEGARRLYRVPYFQARESLDARGGEVSFESERTQGDGPPAQLAIRYRSAGEAREPEPGSLEYFLTERYCLYTTDERGRVLRGDIHHPPWCISPASASIGANTMGRQIGLELDAEPLLHVAEPQHVVFWRLAPA